MEQGNDLRPYFFAMMFLTLVVWVYMYIRRISFITANELSPKISPSPGELARLSPPAVSNPSDNLKNLFEIPVLFYALVLYLFATKRVGCGVRGCRLGIEWLFAQCTVSPLLIRSS